MSTDDELKRVLANPENVILSESLEGILDDDDDPSQEDSVTNIRIKGRRLICKIEKVKILPGKFVFTLSVPSLDLYELLDCEDLLILSVKEKDFQQISHASLVWKNNLLTISTRRIFNEAIQA